MSSTILSSSDIEVSKIEFGAVKVLDSGGKSVPIRYEGRNIMLETPSLSVPFGVNVFDKTLPAKYSVDLSLRGADENADIGAFKEFFEAFDERMIDAGVENAAAWFKMAKPNREVIKAFYTPVVKMPGLDQNGQPKPYPPTVKLALRKRIAKKGGKAEDGKEARTFETAFYNSAERDEGGQITAFDGTASLDNVIPKRSQVTTIMQCTGVWFAGGKFGTTWKAVQMRVDSQPEQIRGPAFRSDAPDIRSFVSKSMNKAATTNAVADYEEDADDNEEEGDDDVVAAVTAPAVKKAAAPAPAPAPAAAFEEEAVAEPVAVPKKVAKKVITKKTT
jgi:hypothetical protein